MLSLVVFILIVIVIVRILRASEAIGNWNHLFAEMNHDPEDFYKLVEEILEDRQVPDIRTSLKTFKQGGLLSHQRLYLEVARGDYIFHICAAPWGTGFFFSWWPKCLAVTSGVFTT